MKRMNIKMFFSGLLVFAAVAITAMSCSEWTEPQSLGSNGTPGTEGGGSVYNKPSEAYAENLRQYFKSPHRLVHGWFGNWTGIGSGALMSLPDSTDLISLWLCTGNLNADQQADVKAFRERGGRAVLCWRAGNIGDGLTPAGVRRNTQAGRFEPVDFWGVDYNLSVESRLVGARNYANAIIDTVRKYDLDGFDYDFEDGGTLYSSGEPEVLETFLLTLADAFDEDGRMLIIDMNAEDQGQPANSYRMLTQDVVTRVTYFIWQLYKSDDPSSLNRSISDSSKYPDEVNQETIRRSIYTSSIEESNLSGHFLGQARTMSARNTEFTGLGVYHIEYDYAPAKGSALTYPQLREVIRLLNPPIGIE